MEGARIQLAKEQQNFIWTFAWGERVLKVAARVNGLHGDQSFCLSISGVSMADFKAQEVAAAMDYVIRQLRAQSSGAAKIEFIYMPGIVVSEWSTRLKDAARDSVAWQSWLRHKATDPNLHKIVISLLTQAHVFRELETACKALNLELKVAYVEKILTERYEGISVPVSAMITINTNEGPAGKESQEMRPQKIS